MTKEPTAADPIKDKAHRLTASRRWTHADLDLLQVLLDVEDVGKDELVGADEGRTRSLASLVKLGLAVEAEGKVRIAAEAKAVGALILEGQIRRKARAAARNERHEDARGRTEDQKRALAAAIRTVFPAIPDEVAMAAATRLAPGIAKLGGRRPGAQALIDVVAAIRLDRWRQAVATEPDIAARLAAMQSRGDPARARKRYRDQRAVDRVEAELREWRGSLGPVVSKRLG